MATPVDQAQQDRLQQIEILLEGLEEMAESDSTTPINFFQQLVDRATFATSALGTAFWLVESGNAAPKLACNPEQLELQSFVAAQQTTFSNKEEQSLEPSEVTTANQVVLVNPIRENGVVQSFLTSHFDNGTPKAKIRAVTQVLGALAEVAEEFLSNHSARNVQQLLQFWQEVNQFSVDSGAQLNLHKSSYILANDLPPLIDCDRVTIFRRRGRSVRPVATTGVKKIHSKSTEMKAMRDLARLGTYHQNNVEISRAKFNQADQSLDKFIAPAAEKYLSISATEEIVLVPFRDEESSARQSTGIAVLEYYTVPEDSILTARKTAAVLPIAESSWNNALRYDSIPGRGLSEFLFGWTKKLSVYNLLFTTLILATIVGLAAAGWFIRSPQLVDAEGQLQPVEQQNVFASVDGEIKELFVQHGDSVAKDQPLLQLTSLKLEKEAQRIRGEIAAVAKKLDGLLVTLNQLVADSNDNTILQTQISGEVESVRLERQNLETLLKLVEKEQAQLQLDAPISGTVLTWEVEQKLSKRPVSQGNAILRVANLEGKWVVEFRLPDRNAGYVLAAFQRDPNNLKVTFSLASDPKTQYESVISSISQSTVSRIGETPYVRVLVNVPDEIKKPIRPGVSVVGKINCGDERLFYAWFYEIIDGFRREFFW